MAIPTYETTTWVSKPRVDPTGLLRSPAARLGGKTPKHLETLVKAFGFYTYP